jgi:hypothetical protein
MQEWKVGGGKEKGAAREREGVFEVFHFHSMRSFNKLASQLLRAVVC